MTQTSVPPAVSRIGIRPSSYIDWPNNRAETFTFLLGWGVLLHKLAKSDFVTSMPSLLTTAAAITLVFRPRSVVALSALFVGIIGQVVIGFDLFGNHWPFLALLGIVWLAMVVRRWSMQRRWPILASVGPSFLTVTRYAVVAMWAVVVLHKANRGFFALPESCAVRLYEQSRRLLVALPPIDQWWPASLPPSVFAVEAAIAIGLLWPRARTLAVPLAVAFHVLSGAAVPSFAGVAFALYVPFIRPDLLGAAFGWVADLHQRRPLVRWIADCALLAMGSAGCRQRLRQPHRSGSVD